MTRYEKLILKQMLYRSPLLPLPPLQTPHYQSLRPRGQGAKPGSHTWRKTWTPLRQITAVNSLAELLVQTKWLYTGFAQLNDHKSNTFSLKI